MNGRQLLRTAKFVQTLIFYDQPQLILLTSDRNENVIGVAISKPDMEYPFFCGEVRNSTFSRYLEGRADLRYLLDDAIRQKYYFLDLKETEGDDIPLIPADADEARNPAYWPLPGAFSRSHTFPYGVRPQSGTATKVFKIDGNWSASDFSHFHGKISNLYAMMIVLHNTETDHSELERRYIKESIQRRFWAGGGSYVGFYDDLFNHVRISKPLDVAKIVYASPGQIALSGDADAFSDIGRIIEQFENNHRQFRVEHNGLRQILARERLLRPRGRSTFSNPELARKVRADTTAFAGAMRIGKIEEIYEACDRNAVIFCKVILSIYWRANEIYMFHAEGRIQESSITSR
jgi:hypothetical protein